METTVFALPIKAGKSDDVARFLKELTGQHADDYSHTRSRHGLTSLRVWHQTEPVEQVIVELGAKDLDEFFIRRIESDHAHDSWLDAQLEELTGLHHPVSRMVLDWHAQHGHRVRHG